MRYQYFLVKNRIVRIFLTLLYRNELFSPLLLHLYYRLEKRGKEAHREAIPIVTN